MRNVSVVAFLASASILTLSPHHPVMAAQSGMYIGKIRVEGSQRIEPASVIAQSGLAEGTKVSGEDLDTALKKLFNANLFTDVSFRQEGQTLIIQVVENAIVNQVAFEGNDKISDDILKGETQLKPRQVYTLTRLKADTQRIQDIYRLKGHFAATVNPKIIKREQNRVDVVFEINEGEATVVRRIFFVGNKRFSESKLESIIQTKETRWYRFFTSDDNYDPDRLAYDRELLRRFYLEHGYADFKINSAVAELTPDRKEFFITFTVDEGERYKVDQVTVSTKLPKVDPDVLKKQITIGSGDWYSSKAVEHAVNKLTDELGSMGYAFVEIQPNLERDKKTQKLSITFDIQEGPKVYIGQIRVMGNVRTNDEVIRREMQLHEGDAFSANKLKESESRLKDLGFFKKVNIKREPTNAPDVLDLIIEVEEDRTGEISLGGGFSTADGPIVDLHMTEHNFMGKGQVLRFGGAYAKRRKEIDLGFTEPYFLDRDLSAGFDVFHTVQNRHSDATYDHQMTGTTLHLGYNLTENLAQTLSYTIREDKLSNVSDDASDFVREQKGSKLLSAVGQELVYDRRDSRLNPTEGWFVGLANDLAGVGGQVHYLKNTVFFGYYYPVMDEVIFELSGRYRFMHGLGKRTRIVDRYTLGGDSLRGFEPGGVSPRDRKSHDPLGGLRAYTGSAEVTFPLGLPKEFGITGATFFDVGAAYKTDIKNKSNKVVDSSMMRAAYGAGIRWRSFLGPLRIDFGKAIRKHKLDETKLVLFGFSTRF
ncbi:MAG: outer membrane protein assembly factor BamA [Holosporales bacterium]